MRRLYRVLYICYIELVLYCAFAFTDIDDVTARVPDDVKYCKLTTGGSEYQETILQATTNRKHITIQNDKNTRTCTVKIRADVGKKILLYIDRSNWKPKNFVRIYLENNITKKYEQNTLPDGAIVTFTNKTTLVFNSSIKAQSFKLSFQEASGDISFVNKSKVIYTHMNGRDDGLLVSPMYPQEKSVDVDPYMYSTHDVNLTKITIKAKAGQQIQMEFQDVFMNCGQHTMCDCCFILVLVHGNQKTQICRNNYTELDPIESNETISVEFGRNASCLLGLSRTQIFKTRFIAKYTVIGCPSEIPQTKLPANSDQQSISMENQTVAKNLTCDDGYTLNVHNITDNFVIGKCTKREWEFVNFTCALIGCASEIPQTKLPANSNQQSIIMKDQTEAKNITCDDGFTINSPNVTFRIAKCNYTKREWQFVNFKCEGIKSKASSKINKINSDTITGIVCGIAGIAGIIVVALVVFFRKRKVKGNKPTQSEPANEAQLEPINTQETIEYSYVGLRDYRKKTIVDDESATDDAIMINNDLYSAY